ncbi:MAG: hypothetical protein KJP21_01885, partial [Bacteroidia bacterium]|nr:hypothetical protein [Bacteroidia bacterium]
LQQETNDYSNMAGTMSVMVPWFATRGMRDSAYLYLEKCRKLSEKNGYLGRIAFLQIKQAALLIEEAKYSAAADTAAIAAKFYEDQDNPDQTIHALAFQALALDSLKNHKKSSQIYARMYHLMKESFTKSRAESVAESEVKFKTQQKELENQKLIADNKSKQLKMNQLILGLVSLGALLIGGFLFYRNRLKKKQLELKAQELDFKNKIIKSNMESEERERSRIARELHDGVGQQISSIKLGLENIDSSQRKTEGSLSDLRQMVADVLHSVRGISHQMMPLALQRFGLVKAIDGLVDFLNQNTKIKFSFENLNCDNLKMESQREIQCYRIIQELTTNVNKHSRATQASIQMYTQHQKLNILVSDNGKGFQVDKLNSGMGLSNVNLRLSTIEGTMLNQSQAGETLFHIVVPINPMNT